MALLMISGCADNLVAPGSEQPDSSAPGFISTKVVNTPDRAVEGVLMVKAGANGQLSLDDLDLSALSITSVERVFRSTPENAKRLEAMGMDSWYVVRFDDNASLSEAAGELSKFEKIEKIQFNTRLQKSYDGRMLTSSSAPALPQLQNNVFNDPELLRQWHYNNLGSSAIATTAREGADVNVAEAWRLTAGDPSIVVAVVDDGIKYTHSDLAANMWVNEREANGLAGVDDDGNGLIDDIHGYNFVSDGPINWVAEGSGGHGTHVAGTVAAVNNNGIGVCGVAGGTGNGDGVKLMSCQIFDGKNGGDALTSARAIMYATDMGADIIQASYGYSGGKFKNDEEFAMYCPLEATALDYFFQFAGRGGAKMDAVLDGGIAIYAAGNETANISGYPAAYAGCISVTAIGPDYLPTNYTNYGPGCNIAAPGGEFALNKTGEAAVYSTVPSELTNDGSDYAYMQGTSMACPHVSGVAALGLSYLKKLGKQMSAKDFKALLLTSVNDLESHLDRSKNGVATYKYHGKMGTGLVDAWKLLMNIEGTPSLMVPVGQPYYLDLSPVLGGSSQSLATLLKVEVQVDDQAREALGLTEDPALQYGKLKIKATRTGSAKITVKMIVDYKVVQGDRGPQASDVTTITKEISIISRGVASSNGGWL